MMDTGNDRENIHSIQGTLRDILTGMSSVCSLLISSPCHRTFTCILIRVTFKAASSQLCDTSIEGTRHHDVIKIVFKSLIVLGRANSKASAKYSVNSGRCCSPIDARRVMVIAK